MLSLSDFLPPKRCKYSPVPHTWYKPTHILSDLIIRVIVVQLYKAIGFLYVTLSTIGSPFSYHVLRQKLVDGG